MSDLRFDLDATCDDACDDGRWSDHRANDGHLRVNMPMRDARAYRRAYYLALITSIALEFVLIATWMAR